MTLPIGRQADGTWVAATETLRDAIGSNQGLVVGDLCLVQATDTVWVCLTVAGGDASTWGGPDNDFFGWFTYSSAGSAALRYMDWRNVVEGSAIGVAQMLVVPFDCHVAEVGLLSETSAGVTTIGIHLNKNTTPEESDTMTPPTSEPAGVLTFDGTGHSFLKGETLTISVDPTNGINNARGWARLHRV